MTSLPDADAQPDRLTQVSFTGTLVIWAKPIEQWTSGDLPVKSPHRAHTVHHHVAGEPWTSRGLGFRVVKSLAGATARSSCRSGYSVRLRPQSRVESIEPSAWRLRKATHLVKILALIPGHRLHRDQLIDALWPEVDPDSALSSFHQALHAARRALEPERASRSSGSLLRLYQQVLSLVPSDDVWIDAEAFQAAAASARNSGDIRRCLGALSLYSGDLLPEDLYESWTQRSRDALRSTYLELLFSTARLQEERGAPTEAVETLRRLIEADPLNEAAYASLMQIHARSGRRDQAHRLFQQLSETLHAELDTEPSQELADLHAQISSGELPASVALESAPMAKTRASENPSTSPTLAGGLRISLTQLAAQSGLVNRQTELDQPAASL